MRTQVPKYVINVRVSPELAEKLDDLAHRERSTRTEEIRKAVTEYIARMEAAKDGAQS